MADTPNPSANEQLGKTLVGEAMARRKEFQEWLTKRRGELNLTLELTEEEQNALITVLRDLELDNPVDLVRQVVEEQITQRRQVKLDAMAQRLWPDGPPPPEAY